MERKICKNKATCDAKREGLLSVRKGSFFRSGAHRVGYGSQPDVYYDDGA